MLDDTDMLLTAFVVAAATSALVSLVALRLFGWFRSGERKPGNFRPDESLGSGAHGIEVRTRGKGRTVARPRSSELPLVGGGAMVIGIFAACFVTGHWLQFKGSQWTLLEILMLCTLGYAIVGLCDDMLKVFRGSGITEIQKGIGVIIVSALAAVLINRLVIDPALTARLAYAPFTQAPLIGSLLDNQKGAWVIFFLLMTITIASTTSLAVDFADGMDGLAGGLLFSAALAYAVIMFDQPTGSLPAFTPLIAAALALAGAAAGYLPFNWPSSWKGGSRPKGRRAAKLIMGDTGSLALGGLLALIAIIARQELILIIIGGAFVLEGLSAFISARVLVKFYRRFLLVERFNSSRGFPHTELPLPFLATPMHYHYDLLNIDRRRIVYGAWLLGAGLAILGIASVVGPFTWERYLARLAGLVVLIAVWQSGPWTKAFFIGLERANPTEPEAPRRLVLCHGAPYRLFGIPLYRRIDIVSVTNATLIAPMEPMQLWQRLSVFDARALLGYYCYREGIYEDALRVWDRVPDPNLNVRADLRPLITESMHALALRAVEEEQTAARAQNPYRSAPPAQGNPAASSARMTRPPRLQPVEPAEAPPASRTRDTAPLWTPSRWALTSGLAFEGAPASAPITTPLAAITAPPANSASANGSAGGAITDAYNPREPLESTSTTDAPTAAGAESDGQ
jgi:UDP-N-acetylmuramyl pentapeptide phosphotransferase/UDP-N-acetylglucosamine-1-phosphate transferase